MIHLNSNQTTVVVKNSQNLTSAHLHDIVEKRGIDAEWAKANCRSTSIKEAKEFLGYSVHSPGIMFIGAGSQVQFRPDKISGVKYLTSHKSKGGYDAFIPKHPTDKGYWDVEQLKQNCWKINDCPYLLVTEGMDDFIQGKGIEEFRRILTKAYALESPDTENDSIPDTVPATEDNYIIKAIAALYTSDRWVSIGGLLYQFTGGYYKKVCEPVERRRSSENQP